MITIEFLITSLIVVLIPGTGVIFTVSTGLTQGKKSSIFAALGCTAGIIPHLSATIFGLAAVMHTSALAFQTLRYAGVAYLLYIAFTTWTDKSTFSVDSKQKKDSNLNILTKAFMMNILNPKLTIFFLAFLPQFVQSKTVKPIVQLLTLSIIFMLMTFVIFVIYGYIAHIFRTTVIESQRTQKLLRKGFAFIFLYLGLNLAFSKK